MSVVQIASANNGRRWFDWGDFRFAENGTTWTRDLFAGLTTFMVMSYIIFLNPIILGFVGIKGLEAKGLPFNGVLTATCIVAGVMTILMGLVTNRAYAIAPGLGLNAIVAFQLVATEGLSFPAAMGLIFLEGIVALVLVVTGAREAIMRAIPIELKKAIAIGIGFFLVLIGLYDSGIVVKGSGTPVTLGHLTTWPLFIAILGIAITFFLYAQRERLGLVGLLGRGAILFGIVALTVVATLINRATDYQAGFTSGARWPEKVTQSPDFSLFGNFNFDAFSKLGVISAIVWIFALFLSDFFDTMGTLIGVGQPAGYLTEDGDLPEIKGALIVDSAAAAVGGAASTSSATNYIEAGAGVAAGGRTGFVSVVAGACFFPFIYLSPLIGMVPAQATAAALVLVGYLMVSILTISEEQAEPGHRVRGTKLSGIDFSNFEIGAAALLTITIMPFTYSITNGIGWGFIAYTGIRWARGKGVHPLMAGAALLFLLYFLVPLGQDHLSWM